MVIPVEKHRYSVEEYLKKEREAVDRHEYHDGEILAMSGGSLEQSLIAVNIASELRNALKGKPCRVAESNLRVRIAKAGRYVYPDALVFCGAAEFDPLDDKRHTIINPRVIIEVLSPSTEAYDRGDQFAQYREIETFEEYILISQDRANVESWLRQADGAWSIVTWSGLEGSAHIRSLKIAVALAEIYAGVEWPVAGGEAAAPAEG